MTFPQVQAFAVEHGIDAPRLGLNANSRVAYLTETRTIGHHTCKVEIESGIVKSSEYRLYD